MFRLNEPQNTVNGDPVAYEQSLCGETRSRVSPEISDPPWYEIARLDGRPVNIPYAQAARPSGALKQIKIVIGGIPILNTAYQSGEVAVFLVEVADALIAAGIATEV